MITNELLIKWMNGTRNYTIGQVLYNQFGNDDAIKAQLATGNTDYTAQVLLQQITGLINGEQQKAPEQVISSYEEIPDHADEVLQSLKNKWMPLYTEMNYKRHALDKLLDDDFEKSGVQRGQMARDILLLEKQCIEIWQQRDHYQKYGTLPGMSIDEETVIDPFKAAKRIETLKIYVRRYKNTLSKTPGNAMAAQLLRQYTDELTQLQTTHG